MAFCIKFGILSWAEIFLFGRCELVWLVKLISSFFVMVEALWSTLWIVEIDGSAKQLALWSIIDWEWVFSLYKGNEASNSFEFELLRRTTSGFYDYSSGDLNGDRPGDLDFSLSFYVSMMSFVNGIRNWWTLIFCFLSRPVEAISWFELFFWED